MNVLQLYLFFDVKLDIHNVYCKCKLFKINLYSGYYGNCIKMYYSIHYKILIFL